MADIRNNLVWGWGRDDGESYGYGTGVGYGRSVTYDEGTLILDVIDPPSQQIAWRGFGTSQSRDPQLDAERLRVTVTEIVKHFPPEAAAAAQ